MSFRSCRFISTTHRPWSMNHDISIQTTYNRGCDIVSEAKVNQTISIESRYESTLERAHPTASEKTWKTLLRDTSECEQSVHLEPLPPNNLNQPCDNRIRHTRCDRICSGQLLVEILAHSMCGAFHSFLCRDQDLISEKFLDRCQLVSDNTLFVFICTYVNSNWVQTLAQPHHCHGRLDSQQIFRTQIVTLMTYCPPLTTWMP